MYWYFQRIWRLDPKIIKKPLIIKPLLKQICKKTSFPFFEASFSFSAMKWELFFMVTQVKMCEQGNYLA